MSSLIPLINAGSSTFALISPDLYISVNDAIYSFISTII